MLQLAKEGKLNATTRWRTAAGLLPYGNQITIRQLMSDTSGLVDDFDGMFSSRNAFERALRNVKDPKLQAHWTALATRLQKNPETRIDPIWLIRLAAWQPLLSAPGSRYHHSNVGWKIAGLIAAKAGGRPLAALYRKRIVEPLGLTQTAYSHKARSPDRTSTATRSPPTGASTSTLPFGMGADGGVVTDAPTRRRYPGAGRRQARRATATARPLGRPRQQGRRLPGDAFLGIGATTEAGATSTATTPASTSPSGTERRPPRLPSHGRLEGAVAARHLYCGT